MTEKPTPTEAPALESPTDPLLLRVLNALKLNRAPGFHFPGHFLRISFDQLSTESCRVSMPLGPHNQSASGAMDQVALGIFIDLALAATVRSGVPGNWRLATVSLQLQFTGKPVSGSLTAQGRFNGWIGSPETHQALGEVRITSGGELIALGVGTFMVMPAPAGLNITPMRPWNTASEADTLKPSEFTPTEAAIYQIATKARWDPAGFPETFWGLRARAHSMGSFCRLKAPSHVRNRVGHIQGGVLVGQALTAVKAAAPSGWFVNSLCLNFLTPGMAPGTLADARVLHQGRSTAVAEVEIRSPDRHHLVQALATMAPTSR